jgi:predicted RNase H-like HicB family nuclease
MTLDGTETLIREAMTFHIKGFQADGQPIPPSHSQVEYIEVSV